MEDTSFCTLHLLQGGRCAVKIRHPWAIKAFGIAAAGLVRLWGGTMRYRYRPLGPDVNPVRLRRDGRYIFAFWHENLLAPAFLYGRGPVTVLISEHADGRLVAEACRRLGLRTVAGSSTRGGVRAVRELLRQGRIGHLAVAPDGPRGPRRKVQPGLIYLAAKTGLPIVPGGFGYGGAWRMRSWDRFALPHPWSTLTCVTTAPIHVPADLRKGGLEAYRLRVEEALGEATAAAEQRAAG
jgi:lysophospholipid acyltransferase (LPLAT)-like uncharacterized protein